MPGAIASRKASGAWAALHPSSRTGDLSRSTRPAGPSYLPLFSLAAHLRRADTLVNLPLDGLRPAMRPSRRFSLGDDTAAFAGGGGDVGFDRTWPYSCRRPAKLTDPTTRSRLRSPWAQGRTV